MGNFTDLHFGAIPITTKPSELKDHLEFWNWLRLEGEGSTSEVFLLGPIFLEICSLPGSVVEGTISGKTSLSLARQITSTIQKLLRHWKAINDSVSFH